MDYRQRLYDAYFSAHYSQLGAKSAQDLRHEQDDFEACFGEFLPDDAAAKMLDVGCGTGTFLAFLSRKGYRDIRGIDRSPQQVEQARKAGPFHVEAADAAAYLGRHPGEFDRVFALDVLEHLRKDEVMVLLDRAHGALKPGGRLALRTVNGASPMAGRIIYGDFTHETAFTQASLGQILRAAGFGELRFPPAYPASLARGPRGWLRYALWKTFEQAVKLYMHAATGAGILHSGHIWTDEIVVVAEKARLAKG